MGRSENKSTAKVMAGWLYAEDASDTCKVGSAEWIAWLGEHGTFYFESFVGTFTARRELRRGKWFWYAFRKHAGKLHKVYLGKADELGPDRLLAVAEALVGRVGV